jgi:hypothetical protein
MLKTASARKRLVRIAVDQKTNPKNPPPPAKSPITPPITAKTCQVIKTININFD